MKNILIILIALTMSICAHGQNRAFKYQAVAHDQNGHAIVNKDISLEFNIINNSGMQTTEYIETHSVRTSDLGIFHVNIGQGTVVQGDFNLINWATSNYSINVAMDQDGGSNYSDMGTLPLLYVPYAMHAETVTNKDDADADPQNEFQDLNLTGLLLSIENGNSVDMSTFLSPWEKSGNDISYNEGKAITKSIHTPGFTSMDHHVVSVDNEKHNVSNHSAEGLFTSNDSLQTFSDVSAGGYSCADRTLGNSMVIGPHIVNMTTDNGANQMNIYTTQMDFLDSSQNYQASYGLNYALLEAQDGDVTTDLSAGSMRISDQNKAVTSRLDHEQVLISSDTGSQSANYSLNGALISSDNNTFSHLATDYLRLSSDNHQMFNYSYGQSFSTDQGQIKSNQTSRAITFDDKTGPAQLSSILSNDQMNISRIEGNTEDEAIVLSNVIAIRTFENGNPTNNLSMTPKRISMTENDFNSGLLPDQIKLDYGQRERLKLSLDHRNLGELEIMNDVSVPIISLRTGDVPDEAEFVLKYGDTRRFKAETTQEGATMEFFQNNNSVLTLQSDAEGGKVTADEINARQYLRRIDDPNNPIQEIVSAAVQAREILVSCRGTDQLVSGNAVIYFPYDFVQIANHTTMTVTITPHDANTYGLAVTDKFEDGFRVEELVSKTGNFTFDWEVKCVRKGEEGFQSIRLK